MMLSKLVLTTQVNIRTTNKKSAPDSNALFFKSIPNRLNVAERLEIGFPGLANGKSALFLTKLTKK